MQNDEKKNPVEALASTRREQTEDQTSQKNFSLSLPLVQDIQQAIEVYTKLGWKLVPLYGIENGFCACSNLSCSSPGKHPLTPRGVYDASDDPNLLQWWSVPEFCTRCYESFG